ncbi:hypothetical protein PoB_002179400 [Plakobranchus ocellatus]|uniref:Uncharacterized protein n=1 Tax=Plakobranchus ocellatus TaxID=259542 RepID=A0AAV3ZN41_9GAST|nr:hypothetical protein PoB_002179400 [Plakobranchus ocellatus]
MEKKLCFHRERDSGGDKHDGRRRVTGSPVAVATERRAITLPRQEHSTLGKSCRDWDSVSYRRDSSSFLVLDPVGNEGEKKGEGTARLGEKKEGLCDDSLSFKKY